MRMSKYYNLVLFVLFAGLVGCLSDSTADSQEPLKVETVDGLLRINVLQDDIIRVSFEPPGFTSAAESFVVNRDWEPVD